MSEQGCHLTGAITDDYVNIKLHKDSIRIPKVHQIESTKAPKIFTKLHWSAIKTRSEYKFTCH